MACKTMITIKSDEVTIRERFTILEEYARKNPFLPATSELLKEIGVLKAWLDDVTEQVLDELDGVS